MNLIASILLLSLAQDQTARWNFDVDAGSAGSKTYPTKIEGRLEYIDSPVGRGGRLAVFNGVDAYLQVEPAGTLGFGARDWTVSLWVFALDKRPAPLMSRKTWSLSIIDNGGLRFTSDLGRIEAPAGSCPAGQWTHVVLSIERDRTSRLFVNGDIAGTGAVKSGDLDPAQAPLLIAKGVDDPKLFTGLLDEIALYDRSQESSTVATWTDQGLPWLRVKSQVRAGLNGKYGVDNHEVIVFTGGEDARVGQDLGYLETLLTLGAGGRPVHFRNMAWEGDTVYEQLRPLNFGSWSDQFRRCGATTIIAQFGQVEVLQGKESLERFIAAYEALLAQFEKTTKRIIVISPAPFAKGRVDLSGKNEDLKLYVEAIRKMCTVKGYFFVDLTTPPMTAAGLSRDGLHLSDAGQWAAARETARQLEIPGVSDLDAPDAKGAFKKESLEKLRSAIRVKNGLWTESWRPTNWAFLNGDRMEQPSSRDHVDRRIRWFPVEIQRLPAMIRDQETKIESLLEKK